MKTVYIRNISLAVQKTLQEKFVNEGLVENRSRDRSSLLKNSNDAYLTVNKRRKQILFS